MNFVGEFKKVEKSVIQTEESTTDKLLREITDLRLIYNEVLNELDILKVVLSDNESLKGQHFAFQRELEQMKGEINIVKAGIESNSKSIIEVASRRTELEQTSSQGVSVSKKKETGLDVQPLQQKKNKPALGTRKR